MLLDNAHLQTETNCTIEGKSFSIKASPVAFEILSSRLYSNPTLAIVRELLTNAYDSHKAVGKEDVPIKVNLPSYMEPNFIIRDYGLGLCKEDVLELYTTFFDSTKSNSNDFTGCFGLGSKTPFSYTSSFSVNSYWNGTKYYFIATKKDGLPHIYAVREEPTDECNGLEVIIPTDKANGYDISFNYNIEEYLKYIPEILIDCNLCIKREEPFLEKNPVKFYKYEQPIWDKAKPGNCYIKQGQNIYDVNKYISESSTLGVLKHFLKYAHLVIEAPIGTLHITPSRESLSQDEKNLKKISVYIEQINSILKGLLANNVESFISTTNNTPNNNFVQLYNEIMTEKYFRSHPLEPTISFSTRFNTTYCKVEKGCTIHEIDCEGMIKNAPIQQGKKSILLLVPNNFSGANINKLRQTICNYEELEEVKIHIAIPYVHRFSATLLHSAKLLKGLVWTLNNIPEYNFDIEYQTINQFYKKYTNSRKQRTSLSDNSSKKRIRYRCKVVDILGATKNNYPQGTASIDYIHANFPPGNTVLLFTKSDPNEPKYMKAKNFSDKVDVLHYFMKNIGDKEKNNFVLNYFEERLPMLPTSSTLNFVEISKTVKKYFKEYEVISFEKVFNFIEESDWTITSNRDVTLLHFLIDCDSMLRFNYNKRTYETIQKTKTYKKLHILASIANKLGAPGNIMEPFVVKKVNKIIPSAISPYRIREGLSEKILSKNIKVLYTYWNRGQDKMFKRFNKETKKQDNCYTKKLSHQQKWHILSQLKGDF